MGVRSLRRERYQLGLAAILHDIGKMRVPRELLSKPTLLDEREWSTMREHTTWGSQFLAGRDGFELAAAVAAAHHERWDGLGYPAQLRGERIPRSARIVAVAGAMDAITTERPYRFARTVREAVHELQQASGSQFDPDVVAALLRLYRHDSPAIAGDDATRRAA